MMTTLGAVSFLSFKDSFRISRVKKGKRREENKLVARWNARNTVSEIRQAPYLQKLQRLGYVDGFFLGKTQIVDLLHQIEVIGSTRQHAKSRPSRIRVY